MTPEKALENAIALAGSMQALADHLGVTKGAVSQWKLPGRQIPAKHCRSIESMTGGTSRCVDLRPDLFALSLPAAPTHRATDLIPIPGHAGRQLPSPSNILDTVPERAVVGIDGPNGS
ncbi:Cro/CI family transcriptional regulator [Janthinobacterium sp. UMAB-56]|uniref:transcriptional regulator n=1 Tax=Janthinobacterium sp. UMAB-56 TaxID=1365361 RepID=UPI001C573F6B|nr:Cro/CI family transcriptional regulator [Janthinobacterium sp. UMAB-56]